ncbi:SWIM zinc finger family protein [Halobacterium salinarum]|uniref:SWIM zinc finger family protein n=1 Tax=Halobacterium salinarum TaxID=2242 RepID=UPI0025524C59|nr:SWIM zinc finger family protein [Halobacterium salinarum]MDL0135758.1 SWIM zinc finger family protein [Halobacterium salinarum]MDL0138219.1 SWIM zinc finger family protein [Halobacterium salinarum]
MEYPTREAIRSLCTEQSFDRGVDYWNQGRIQGLNVDGGEISATVRGSHDYDVSIDVTDDTIRTHCSCPYDYAGDCKHIVAVLLAVDDRDTDAVSETDPESTEPLPATVDIESLVEQTTADDLREFLLDIIADDGDMRDRFVAFVGEDTGKTVYDYKQELDRLFDDAASRRGMVEHDMHIDFSQYVDLAETHRERGHVDPATDIYRAIAEAIRENMNRIDGGTGYYGREMEQAIEAYAETVTEHDLSHERKRPHIEYLCDAFLGADHGFASDSYDDALRTLCTADADLEYWLQLLDERISGISHDVVAVGDSPATETSGDDSSEYTSSDDPTVRSERTDDVLRASDFTDGPLTTEDFTGGALDIEHLAVGTLKLDYFVGDAFEELRIDEPTTVEQHTVDVEPTDSGTAETGISESLLTRRVLSTYIYLLEQLDSEDALTNLYDDIYLEHTRFCKQYAQRLIDDGEQDRAIEVLEDGIHTFRSPRALRWLAADCYKERDPEAYRKTLKRLFLDHTEWDAYDELKSTCSDQEWKSTYEEFEQHFERDDRKNLVKLYVHDDDLEKAFAELKDSEDLSLVREHRDSVATVDPVEYFERYRELLVPFAANDTGRRHYRDIADHLEEMQELVSEARFEEFVDFLKDKHSNRPAFLDELEKAGF